MTRPADYIDAHERHWQDAEFLFRNGRWDNASQLHGFSAECGLKALMKNVVMQVDQQGKPVDPKYLKHIQGVWPLFRAFAAGRQSAKLLSYVSGNNPFVDWSQNDRYAGSTTFIQSAGVRHKRGAESVHLMVQHWLAGTI